MDTNALPVVNRDVIHRPERNGVLLFQVRTDEMHYISPDAYRLFQLCDGTHTLDQIITHVDRSRGREATAEERDGIVHFFDELAQRSLVEVWR